MTDVALKRTIGPVLLTFYGLGTIVGAGIYVLVGEVAAAASYWMPFSFVLAGIIAGLTALSYADLSTRMPVTAGEAAYTRKAWGKAWISRLVGSAIVLTGTVSAATIASGFVGYLNVFVPAPALVTECALVLLLGLIAAVGIRSSALVVFTITVLEVGGLVYCIALALLAPGFSFTLPALPDAPAMHGIILGSVLAFYAFIGFEDMVSIVEEVKDPARSYPLAILVALSVSMLLYVLLGLAALGAVGAQTLAASNAPMATLVSGLGGNPSLISAVSLLAVVNGALVQMVMGARVLYGMSRQSLLPPWFGEVNQRTHTPLIATAVIVTSVLAFALLLPLVALARLTSLLMLGVFVTVNLSLLTLQRRSRNTIFSAPAWVPAAGAITALGLIVYQLSEFAD